MNDRNRTLIPRATIAVPMADQAPVERADAARNRQRILAAAGRIVAGVGAEALSLDEVARASGVGVGTVYRRFGDRAGLLYALIDERERQFQAAFMEGPPPLGPGAPPAERLRAFLHSYLDRIEEQRELLVNIETSSSADRFDRGPYVVRHLHVADLLSQLRPEADVNYLADALLAALSPSLVQHQRATLGRTTTELKAGMDDLLDLLLPPHGQRT